jgi:hypothetical protein
VIAFIVLSLAVWRLSSLLVHEDGPFDIFLRFRHLTGVGYDEWSNVFGSNEVSRVLTCLWCTSVWVGIALAVLYYLFREPVVWVASPFALSAGAVIVERVAGVAD